MLVLSLGCVDRIDFNTHIVNYPVVVEGFISDQPGPYEVRITRSFDVQSKNAIKVDVSAKKVEIFDEDGNFEVLSEIKQGVYQTSAFGMQGQVGKAYKLKVEFLDGTIYESVPDTLMPTGNIDDVYFSFVNEKKADLTNYYGFDIYFDAQLSENHIDNALWRVVGTFQVDTNPEQRTVSCGESKCPNPPPCSGWVANGFNLTEVGPCTCCTCWVNFESDLPIVSDNLIIQSGKYKGVKAYRFPLDGWVFQHKVYIKVNQMGLSPKALAFWKAIKAQKEANGSLFQPITGIVPNNFKQLSGEPAKIEGFFFSTSIHSKGIFITRDDVPETSFIPSPGLAYQESCLNIPHSTNQKPIFWQ